MSNSKFKGLSVTFWEKNHGKFALSHKMGLTEDQILELQKLKPGDQLIVYVNDKRGDTSPSHTLRLFVPRREDDGGL